MNSSRARFRVCFCSANGIRTEPRFRRHAICVARAFPNIDVQVLDGGTTALSAEDHAVFKGVPNVQLSRSIYPTKLSQPFSTIKTKLQGNLSRMWFRVTGKVLPSALSVRSWAMERALRHVQADLYFSYTIDTCLPVYNAAKKNNAKWIFDSMEYFADMTSEQAASEKQLISAILQLAIPSCSMVSASSETMSRELRQEYDSCNIFGIENVPPKVAQLRMKRNEFSLYWRNTVIAFSERGLQDVIDALALLPSDVVLYLQGYPSQNGSVEVHERIHSLGLENRVRFLPPHGPDEAVIAASEFCIGLCPERGGSKNQELTVSNKLYDFMMAGMAVICSDLPGISTVLMQADCGVTFKRGDSKDLREKVLELYQSPSLLREYSENSRRFALQQGNLEAEMDKYLRLVSPLINATRGIP